MQSRLPCIGSQRIGITSSARSSIGSRATLQAMRHQLLPLLLLPCLLLSGCASIPTYYEIGAVHRTVTTSSPEAQLWFDRGLALCYGFNHEAAVICFEAAAAADAQCAGTHWGRAYALGPNYNNAQMSPTACRSAHEFVQMAKLATGRSNIEDQLITAFEARYPTADVGDRAARDRAYADAMRALHQKYPHDADITAMTAESVMQLRPWKLWTPAGEPAPEIAEIRALLEGGLAEHPNHPALCHLYIHAMEAGPEPSKALSAAQRLETMTPGLGHLVHMPSHIYIWTGRYEDSLRVNQAAVAVDEVYAAHAGSNNFYLVYRLHNYHFIAYSAMWTGRREVAMQAARQLVAAIPPESLTGMVDFLDIFTATPLHVMVRFGMWDEILREPQPAAELLAHRAVWHYARGIALAVLGRVPEAQAEQQAFRAARAAVPKSRVLFNNPVADILAVADAVLAGELEYRRGDHTRAFVLLRQGVKLDAQLNYDEPWGWMEPARHALGALLCEQGHYQEAEQVYRRNLERYPNNGWALHGLAECLSKTGRQTEAADTKARFNLAWANADIELAGSCFCRTR